MATGCRGLEHVRIAWEHPRSILLNPIMLQALLMATKITKLMSMSRNEFIHSFKKFAPDYRGSMSATSFRLDAGKGSVTIEIEVLPDRAITSLFILPQANVTLTMDGLSQGQQKKFMERFDISFQRGGG